MISHGTCVLPSSCLAAVTIANRSSHKPRSHKRNTRVTASLVPDFPRLAEPVHDWLAKQVPQLPGFNGEDLTRLLLPDLQRDPARAFTTFTIGGALLIAFLYWEGGIILHEIQERRDVERQRGEEGSGTPPPNKPLTPQQQALYDRKRGLAWLAILTALAIWCTGVVNTPAPFMP